MPSLVAIGLQIKEKQRGGHNVAPPSLYGSKDPSLNRVKGPGVFLGTSLKSQEPFKVAQ